jgi:cell wall-associated NlpC family hydrolase
LVGRHGFGILTRILIGSVCGLGLGAGAYAAGAIPAGGHNRMGSGPTAATADAGGQPFKPMAAPAARPAWIAVPVATIWDHPAQARAIDSSATAADADVGAWVTTMSVTQKLELDNLLATQALLYDPVMVTGQSGTWDQVIVLGQKGAVYPSGIVGWVPSSQLTFRSPPSAATTAVVRIPVLGVGRTNLSYGTRIPVAAAGPRVDRVQLPSGTYSVPSSYLRASSLLPSGPQVVAEAKQFLGLPYLWAGTSGFGYDCSGLTYSVYRQFGITLDRDAADQARQGRPVSRGNLRPGDLVFFDFGSGIDHVGIYAGNGMMIDSPHTGGAVELVPLWGGPLASYYVTARRYV